MTSIGPRLTALVALALLTAACGGSSEAVVTTPQPAAATTSTITSTTAVSPGETSSSTTTSTAPPAGSSTTTTLLNVALPRTPVQPLPVGPDGRPATFLAITNDFEAVEVETVSGTVLRSIGQADNRAAVEAAEVEAAVAVIDGVWRTRDGSQVLVSICCEPAQGLIFYLAPSEVFRLNPAPVLTSAGWAAAVSPVDSTFAVIGYDIRVGIGTEDIYREDLFDRFGGGAPAYSLDGGSIYWLTNRGDSWWLESAFLAGREPRRETHRLEWVQPDGRLSGLAADADGNYVTFQTDDAFGITEAMVISPAGALVDSYEVEDGSVIGSYDATGTFLIYADGAGVIRWQGNGEVGELGSGYVFATW